MTGQARDINEIEARSAIDGAPPARVLVVEREAELAGLFARAITAQLNTGQVETITPSDDGFVEAWGSATLGVCGAGRTRQRRFDDLELMIERRPEARVIFLVPADEPECVERAIELGASDVLARTPGYLEQLPMSVRKNLALAARDAARSNALSGLRESVDAIQQENLGLRALVDQLKALSVTDTLTDLCNRRGVEERLETLVAGARRYATDLSVLIVDLDGLKSVNDVLGHAAGDELLRLAGDSIRRQIRRADVAGRVGGDEFVIAMPHTNSEGAALVAERLRQRFTSRVSRLQQQLDEARLASGVVRVVGRASTDMTLGMTIGISSLALTGATSGEELVASADAALYEGKRAGKARVVVAGRAELTTSSSTASDASRATPIARAS